MPFRVSTPVRDRRENVRRTDSSTASSLHRAFIESTISAKGEFGGGGGESSEAEGGFHGD